MLNEEPWMGADWREKRWDDKCTAAPYCCHCKGSVYPHDTYLEIDDMIYCEPCVRRGTRNTDDLEV